MQSDFRKQTDSDERNEEFGQLTAIDTSHMIDRTRQEYKDEADINLILKRFGVNGHQLRPVAYGTADYDLDLQTSIQAIRDSQRAYYTLSEQTRRKYPTWQKFVDAIAFGDFAPPAPAAPPDPAAPPIVNPQST